MFSYIYGEYLKELNEAADRIISEWDKRQEKNEEAMRQAIRNGTPIQWIKSKPLQEQVKEAKTMQVSYNGFTGELVKLERLGYGPIRNTDESPYALIIYDIEKKVTHSFTDVKLADVKFLGWAVSFGG